ncbi:glycosyltransferase [Mesorhizobium sp. M1088]|uniref:glycosyltransferase n=1 Tax=Mesorhizobium sp. M1088 TaxID=2957056 RepID=UPI0033372364
MKEYLKKIIIRNFSGALVAGGPHERYLNRLGMSSDYIRRGYDVVDNKYFDGGAVNAREHASELRSALGLPDKYFMTCSRFVEKKNLSFLIDEYSAYSREMDEKHPRRVPWDLVIVGDGELRNKLVNKISEYGLRDRVHLLGFRQYEALPAIYGLSKTFILASLVEQWGLVVNEAMASGLPVLVSRRCGCAEDLVVEGENGWIFDPTIVGSLAGRLVAQTLLNDDMLNRMGERSRTRIEAHSLSTFAASALEVSEACLNRTRSGATLLDCVVLPALRKVRERP